MRGTAAGEPVVSQAQTKEFDEGFDRTFGAGRKPQRGKWVMTPEGLVPADEYVAPQSENAALHVFTDRHYEGTISPVDGSDIGSRRKRRDHMKAHGLVDRDDAKTEAREKRQDIEKQQDRERHEAFRTAVYQVTEKRRNRR